MRRSRFKGLVAAGLTVAGIGASTISAIASSDMFLKITNVQGESSADKHKGEIDVLAWSWGTSNGGAVTKKGVVPAVCVQDLSLTKWIDSASPTLIAMGIVGQTSPTAVLTVRRAGEGQDEYLKLTMTNVSISSYSTGGSGGEDRLTEQITLHFDSMQGSYTPQGPDGKPGTAIPFSVSGNYCR